MSDPTDRPPGPAAANQDSRNRTLDLVVLPPAQNQIMRLVLRKSELTGSQLWELAQELPESERLSRADFDGALEALATQQLLTRNGDGPAATYKATLQRMAARPKAARIWSALEAAGDAPPAPPPPPAPGETPDRRARAARFWDLLEQSGDSPPSGAPTDEKHD